MERKSFLQMSVGTFLASLSSTPLIQAAANLNYSWLHPELQEWVTANDATVTALLPAIQQDKIVFRRKVGYDFAALTAAYVSPTSTFYRSEVLVGKLELLAASMIAHQAPDGTVNIANLESPPDTAFLVEIVSAAVMILKSDKSLPILPVTQQMSDFLKRAGEGLITGGVHTPNHRWVICAALARLHTLFPNDDRYVHRIHEWLAEGIYQDADGHYPERSSGVYAPVENNSLITMARLLKMPALYQYVRKNLEMTWYYMEPNGDLVTNDSRRQDQYMEWTNASYYFLYRWMAIIDKNPTFASVALQISQVPGFEVKVMSRDYFLFLEHHMLQNSMPQAIAPAVDYEKYFTTSQLLRIRRGTMSATLFGGVDWPLEIASGRSNSPDFFSYRKGKAVLKSLRLSTTFFSMGYFYSEGIQQKNGQYILHKKNASPYYQPLPKKFLKADGDYRLSPSTDGRFWNKMDFQNRPVSNLKEQDIQIIFTEKDGTVTLAIHVTGAAAVPVTLEMCFKEGGKLSGLTALENDNFILEKDFGTYEFEGDTIQFGPGAAAHKNLTALEGERYSTHFGSLRMKGTHVYITGITPFQHTLIFK